MAKIEITIKLTRYPDGRYAYLVDDDQNILSASGGKENATAVLAAMENFLAVYEDRAGGGSGIF